MELVLVNKINEMNFYIQKLKQHHLRTTLPRLQVLKILCEANNAMTAFDIEQISSASGEYLGLSSVYSTLKSLQDCGVVHCDKFENNKALYSLIQFPESG